jgi:NMD protein affecting ribosome stability and mRNA decay
MRRIGSRRVVKRYTEKKPVGICYSCGRDLYVKGETLCKDCIKKEKNEGRYEE